MAVRIRTKTGVKMTRVLEQKLVSDGEIF